jgi:hypothetical protein
MSEDVVTLVEYELVRPDGTLLYRRCWPSHHQISGLPSPNADGDIYYNGAQIMPPWIGRRRKSGGEWETLFERS